MKPKILKVSTVILLFAFLSAGCQKENEMKFSEPIEGYIVGSFICDEVNSETGVGTGNQTTRGFCILLKGSKNTNSQYPMDFYTFDIPEDFFDIPKEALSNRGYDCGPSFFPDSLVDRFKIKFEYRDAKEAEKVKFSCGMCNTMILYFPWKDFNQLVVSNLSKQINI